MIIEGIGRLLNVFLFLHIIARSNKLKTTKKALSKMPKAFNVTAINR